MASRTQMRLAQITGSFGNAAGQIQDGRNAQNVADAALLVLSNDGLSGPMTEMASAIKRIHGASQFARSTPGEFHVDIVPSANNSKDLGSSGLKFAELHLGTSINLDGFAITSIKDEDNMASDSAAALATQQSIKAYVDASVTAQDLDGAGDSGTFAVDLDSQSLSISGGTGLTSEGDGAQRLTISLDNTAVSPASYGGPLKRLTATVDAQGRLTAMGEATIADASTSAKGVASFAAGDFAATSGVITIKAAGVDFAQIQNVAASSVMGVIGVSAGAPADIAIETTLAGNVGKLARADAIKAYADGKLGGFSLDQTGKAAGHAILWDATASAWESAAITGTADQVAVGLSDGAMSIGLPNNVTIQNDLTVTGDLIVSGDQIVANVTDLQIEDKQIELNSPQDGTPISNMGAGLFISGSDSTKDIIYNVVADGGEFRLNTDHGVSLNKAYFVNGNNVLNQTTLGTTVIDSSLTSVSALTGGSIAAAFGAIDNGTSTLDSGAATLASLTVTGDSILNGHVSLGNSASDVITFSGQVANSAIIPVNHNQLDLGSSANRLKNGYFEGELTVTDLNAVSLSAPLDCANEAITNVDINSGAIDGATIGASSASSGVFTSLDCDNKAFAITNLAIAGATGVAIEAGDEFVISDANDSGNGKKATIEAIQTFLAANGSQKHVLLQASPLATTDFLDVGALAGITASLWHAAAEKQQEVYCNGQLLARGDDADAGMDWYKHSVSGQIKFGFALEADDVLQFILRA